MVGPGYDLVGRWIIDCWKNLKLDIIKESFSYCGLSDTTSSYHSELNKILLTEVIPENTTVITSDENDSQGIHQILFDEEDYDDRDYDIDHGFDAFGYR